jgi:PEP-CTERM motif
LTDIDTNPLNQGATLTNSGAFTNYGTFSNAASPTVATVPINIVNNNGTFLNYGALSNNSDFSNNSGATVINEAGATLITGAGMSIFGGTGEFDNQIGATLINNGTLENDLALNSFGLLTNNGSLSNLDSMVLGGTLTNAGTFTNAGSLVINYGGRFNNLSGASFVQNTFGSSIGYETILTVNGTFNSVPPVQIAGGALSGTGTINANVVNGGGVVAGVVKPGDPAGLGTLTINGNYTQGNQLTVLHIELAGTGPGEFSVLDVTGAVDLGGVLELFAENGFTPAAGDDFTFLDFGSLSGAFASVSYGGWQCPTADVCSIVTGANSMSLDITAASTGGGGGGGTTSTPEPSTLVLVAAGFFSAALRARPRRQGRLASSWRHE